MSTPPFTCQLILTYVSPLRKTWMPQVAVLLALHMRAPSRVFPNREVDGQSIYCSSELLSTRIDQLGLTPRLHAFIIPTVEVGIRSDAVTLRTQDRLIDESMVRNVRVQQLQSRTTALLAETLAISYGETQIVSDFSLALRSGEVTAFVGPNGSGKSTILRTLARLLSPTHGTVYLDGADIAHTPTRKIAQQLAILPQEPDAPAGLTVWDLVGYGRYPYQGFLGGFSREDIDAMEWALEVTNLTGFRDRAVDSLSGGERQRAWIAMALAQQTDVLLLDEPTTFLDIRHQIDTLSLVRELNESRQLTVGWVLHDLNQAAAYSDYMVMLQQGQISYEGMPADVMTSSAIRDVFNVDVNVIPDPVSGCPTCLLYGRCIRERS